MGRGSLISHQPPVRQGAPVSAVRPGCWLYGYHTIVFVFFPQELPKELLRFQSIFTSALTWDPWDAFPLSQALVFETAQNPAGELRGGPVSGILKPYDETVPGTPGFQEVFLCLKN